MADNINFTATQGQPSNRGQSVLIKLSLSDIEDNLPLISVGDLATIDSSNNVGYVSNIDTLGGTFTIKPQYPYGSLSSDGSDSILAESEGITVVVN